MNGSVTELDAARKRTQETARRMATTFEDSNVYAAQSVALLESDAGDRYGSEADIRREEAMISAELAVAFEMFRTRVR